MFESHDSTYITPETVTDILVTNRRIGRTERVEKNGDALTFVTSADASMVHDLEHVLNTKLERRTLQGFDYTVSAPDSGYIRSTRQLRRRTVRNQRTGNN